MEINARAWPLVILEHSPGLGDAMESYPVEIDIDAEQIVRWLLVERREGGSGFDVEAWRFNRRRPVEPAIADRFGDEENEDLRDERTVALLEISPSPPRAGWRVLITVESDLEPIDPDEAREDGQGQPIDLDTFFLDYIRPRLTVPRVVAEVESQAAHLDLDHFLDAVATNIHVPRSGRQPPIKHA